MKLLLKEKSGTDEWALTTAEVTDLAKHELTIKSTQGAFIACGRALEAIRDGKLYRAEYPTFEKYCEGKWGWKRAHAYRLIEAAEIVDSMKMSPIGDKIETESQARALAAVPTEQREEVLTRASSKGRPTALRISEEAKKEGPVVDLDRTGYPVPERAMKYWKRADEMQDLLNLISAARSAIRKQNQEDRIFVELHLQQIISILNDAYSQFQLAVPYAVCTTCQGQAPDTCRLCTGRGVISKFRYNTLVPSDLKAVRDKATRNMSKTVRRDPVAEAYLKDVHGERADES